MYEFALGIVGGILTTGIVWMGSRLWTSAILPWWRSVMYRGVDISGTWNWNAETPAGTPYRAALELNQKGADVSGRLRISTTDPSYPNGHVEESVVRGRIQGFVLILEGDDIDRRRLNPAQFMFAVGPDGISLDGAWTWLSVRQKCISHMDVHAHRR